MRTRLHRVWVDARTGGALLPVSWGGPTLAGAWAVHALGILTIPIALVILSGIAALDRANAAELTRETRRRWPLPFSAVLSVLSVVLMIGWVNQL